MNVKDLLERRLVPLLVVTLSQVTLPQRLQAAAARRRGERGLVELFVAYDDPQSAVAILGLRDRLAGRDVDLRVRPVVRRGIPDDAAREAKRRYAVVDATRLAARDGRTFTRTELIDAADVAPLAAATYAAPQPDVFAADVVTRLWVDGSSPWAVDAADPAPVAAAEAEMEKQGLYDTPIAVVHGRWYFAHERLGQIEDWLDELGWTR